ncbi:Ribonuclease D [Streptomyces sp. enrichment culture]
MLEPREGIPPVIADEAGLAEVIAAFAAGSGPVAVDAERASGYRYGQRAYLVQLRRAGAGTALIDPVACPDLSGLGEALSGVEWVLHAATQDLPCLREIGMVPTRLFDTELAGRLAGFPRVGLGAMVENVLGFVLEKGHSAVDWSTRPLPEPWLRYAALDVELLVDLRDALEKELDRQGKLEWARQEFDAIASAPPPEPRKDPWRRTSGMHKVRRRRQLAVVRELWQTRDRIAQRRDVSPGKVLSDAAIVEAALALPGNTHALSALNGFGHRMGRRQLEQWQAAVDRAKALSESQLPQPGQPVAGPPPPRAWADKDPAAAPGCPPPARRSPRWPRSSICPRRTWSRRTRYGGSAGSRRRAPTPRAFPRHWWGTGPGRGRSNWSRRSWSRHCPPRRHRGHRGRGGRGGRTASHLVAPFMKL